ncbi:ABC transporter family protein, partial [Vibrio parahaemolyticus V-223/04]
PSSLMALI